MLNALRHIWRHPLNREARLSGTVRFVRWQIATRLLPGAAVAVPFTDRARLLISRGMYGATQNVYCGLNDFEDMSFVLHYLREGDLFLDVGANVGAYTVLASAAARAQTYAFDPSPAAVDSLRANVELNRIADRVSIEPYALGRAPGTVSVSTSGPSAMHHIGSEGSSSLMEMRTIDSYHLHPSIMKIDVEGYESEVLAGASETAACPELVAIITENNDESVKYGDSIESISSFMSRHGFTAVTYDPWRRSIAAKHKQSDNTLYVRDLEKVKRRVAEAEPFRVFGRSI
ncbi:MAG TPA: FkbM family methyltransferase [Acidobacteriaceae bacterium]|jgi:FkbM family methyltransferase